MESLKNLKSRSVLSSKRKDYAKAKMISRRTKRTASAAYCSACGALRALPNTENHKSAAIRFKRHFRVVEVKLNKRTRWMPQQIRGDEADVLSAKSVAAI